VFGPRLIPVSQANQLVDFDVVPLSGAYAVIANIRRHRAGEMLTGLVDHRSGY
jgi:hypothetical protein